MHLDVIDLKKFYYRTKLGHVTRNLLQESVQRIWRDCRSLQLAGFGFVPPLLQPFLNFSNTIFCLMPSQQGVMAWPSGEKNCTMLVEEVSWPLGSNSVDRLIVSHGLETCDNPNELLREIWRVLTPSGRVIFIVPNRSGLWARSDLTPFGYGRPYSLTQLEQQLRVNRFETLGFRGALYSPPSHRSYFLKTMRFWESIGRRLDSRVVAGALVVEATKLIYAKHKPSLKEAVSGPLEVIEEFAKPKPKPKPISRDRS